MPIMLIDNIGIPSSLIKRITNFSLFVFRVIIKAPNNTRKTRRPELCGQFGPFVFRRGNKKLAKLTSNCRVRAEKTWLKMGLTHIN